MKVIQIFFDKCIRFLFTSRLIIGIGCRPERNHTSRMKRDKEKKMIRLTQGVRSFDEEKKESEIYTSEITAVVKVKS